MSAKPARLLRQSCRPQSFGTMELGPVAADPVAAKFVDARKRLVVWGAAGLAASPEPTQHKHPIALFYKPGIRSSGKPIKWSTTPRACRASKH